jgi:translation elongation factor EF-Ts
MIQFSCETDFVAKTDNFRDGLYAILNTVHKEKDLVWTSEKDDKSALVKELKLVASLDHDVKSQTIDEGIKFVISKT